MAVKQEHTIKQHGKDYVLYEGLLAVAHERYGKKLSIEVEVLQFPTDENGMEAICRATVTTSIGVFSDIGDANPGNVNKNIAAHLLRMSSTRSKARALRDACDIGTTAFEEIAEEPGERPQKPAREARRSPGGQRASSGTSDTGQTGTGQVRGSSRGSSEAGAKASPEQRREITELAKEYFDEGLRELQQKILHNQPIAKLSPEKADQLIATLKRKLNERDIDESSGEASEDDVEVDFDDEDIEEVERIAGGSAS